MKIFWLVLIFTFVALRVRSRLISKNRIVKAKKANTRPMSPEQKKLFTVWIFAKLNTRRFFRDRLALFFGILFPLIFLFIFGSLSRGHNVNFRFALINQSNTSFSKQFVSETKANKLFKVDKTVNTLAVAEDKMSKSQIDAAVVLPPGFGQVKKGHPTGQVGVLYTANSSEAGQALTSLMTAQFEKINARYVNADQPFKVVGKQVNEKSLTTFDYTFAGLLGFAIMGAGIFGPMNVFPELKKQGILRRFRTTPLRVWQYFLSTMLSQAATGLVAIAVMFLAAMNVFHLKVAGNYLEIVIFLAFSIMMILGIGLAIGGWARNERQAAPLGNIVVFPMMFLTGVFFPRFLMPLWLQGVTNFIPLSPVIDGARALITEGRHLTDIGPQLGLMAIWMIIIYAIAFRVFRWE